MHLKEDSEYKALLPRLSSEEYEALKESIKAEGQHLPIVINSDNVILDGYTRYDICKELQIVPKTMVKDFDNKLLEKKFVIISNLQRRHLTTNQKAALAYKLLPIEEELAKERQGTRTDLTLDKNLPEVGKARDLAAKQGGISGETLRQYEIVQEKGTDELKEAVAKNEKSIFEAKEIIDSWENDKSLQDYISRGDIKEEGHKRLINQYIQYSKGKPFIKDLEEIIKRLSDITMDLGKVELDDDFRKRWYSLVELLGDIKK